MIRLLVILSVAGMLLCVVCLSSAVALGGREIATKGWHWNPNEWAIRIDENTDDFSIERAPDGKGGVFVNGERVDDDNNNYNGGNDNYAQWLNSPTETRDFVWTGAGEIDMGMPADVTYTQGPTPKVTVTGPKEALDRFHVDGERFRLRGWSSTNTFSGVPGPGDISSNRPPRLKIAVTAPGVTKFDFSGTETLEIKNYAQDSIDLHFNGASKVTATGTARIAVVDMDGAAIAELGGLSVEQVTAELDGASRAVLAPKSSATIDASGASKVVLTTRPQQLMQEVNGAASVEGPPSAPAPAAAKSK